MPESNPVTARALNAVDDTAELLALAERAVDRARTECSGEALAVADRLKQQIQFLRRVAGLLRHEIKRPESVPRALAGLELSSIDDRTAV